MPADRRKLAKYLLLSQSLGLDGTNALRAGMHVLAPPPDDAWLSAALPTMPLSLYARPEIGGTRITYQWLKQLKQHECLYRFRFTADELYNLCGALDIPQPFKTQNRSIFSNIEALCILLARLRTANDEFELSMQFDRSQSAISKVVNALVQYLDERWAHLLDFDTDGVLAPQRMQEYADAVHGAGAPLDSVWAFLDCTIRHICRPFLHQRVAYNGYKKIHALKYQALNLPNGLIGHLYGPMEGRRNDNALLAESDLLGKCELHARKPNTDNNTPPAARYFQVFGDPAYGVSPLILSPFAGPGERTRAELAWNECMAAVRIEVEHGFAGVLAKWPFLNAWWKHRIYSSPIGRYYRVGALLTNALNCLRPNQTSQFFQCQPPPLEEYFHDR
ncbi:DDE Tnp4 domain-containing protein [Mycena kentingensis (nom. inval.)]|nr:DDE Tnp4 domain-containing protein [Mycena kentingensis (nom. inval.)]